YGRSGLAAGPRRVGEGRCAGTRQPSLHSAPHTVFTALVLRYAVPSLAPGNAWLCHLLGALVLLAVGEDAGAPSLGSDHECCLSTHRHSGYPSGKQCFGAGHHW